MEGHPVRVMPRLAWTAVPVVAALLLLVPASSVYYTATGGEGCARCHEIREPYEIWRQSTHRSVSCAACHGDSFTSGPSFHLANARRLAKHLAGDVPEQVRMKGLDVVRMMERCKGCHRQEFADWQAGPHGSAFSRIFLDAKHNRERLLMDDCLRCHGSYYEGGIRQLVKPIDTHGPWQLIDSEWANQPAIPCLACHAMHRRGEPLRKPSEARPRAAVGEEIQRPSLALFDRRESTYVAAADLPLPAMRDKERPVKMSPDPRQALCYQCHAPLATRQAGSGDDRTGVGVHEGISCLACHDKHGETTRASCASCHPRLSNCGLDVEKMDTTFASAGSRHNIHFAKCADCHTKGMPKRTERARAD
jgi:cytochrome c7-like protein/cytochrome c554/c'-like protein